MSVIFTPVAQATPRPRVPRLSEESLDFLDADPLFLFGIADPSTQKALEKASSVPMLRCPRGLENLNRVQKGFCISSSASVLYADPVPH